MRLLQSICFSLFLDSGLINHLSLSANYVAVKWVPIFHLVGDF